MHPIQKKFLNDNEVSNKVLSKKFSQKIDYNYQTYELAIAYENYIEIMNLLTNGSRKINAVNKIYQNLKKISCLKFSPNSTFLATGEGNNISNYRLGSQFEYEVLFWNNFNIQCENLQPSRRFYSCKSEILNLDFLNNSEYILVLHSNPHQLIIFEISTNSKIKVINLGIEIDNLSIITYYNCLCIYGLGHVDFWNFNFSEKNEINNQVSFTSICNHEIKNKKINVAQFYENKFYFITSKGEFLMKNDGEMNIKQLMKVQLNDADTISSLYINCNHIFVGISN